MTHNASDRKSIRAAEKASAQEDRDRIEIVVALMSHTKGRKYVWDRLAEGHLFHSIFSESHSVMAFQDGQRNQILQLFNDAVWHTPDEFIIMVKEANVREHTATEQSRGANGNGRVEAGDDYDGDDDPARRFGVTTAYDN